MCLKPSDIGDMETEPVLLALLTADRVIQENNGKKGIIGTFDRFFSERFPIMFPPWGIYLSVTNITGDHSFTINIVNQQSQEVVYSVSGGIKSTEFDRVHEIAVNLAPVFPQAGKYQVLFYIDGRVVGAKPISVVNQSATGKGDDDE